MFSWIHIPEVPQENWNEVSKLYISKFKNVTHSEYDHHEIPVVYRNVPSISVDNRVFGSDFVPLIFLSCFTVSTRKGNFFYSIIQKTFLHFKLLNINFI